MAERSRRLTRLVGVHLVLGIACVWAQTNPCANAALPVNNSDTSSSERKQVAERENLDSESEKKALALVETHLPELRPLLQRLKKSEPNEYNKALRDLARSARKLDVARSRSNDSFEIELELLQAQTKVNLLAARLRVRDNARDRRQLRIAIARLQSAQVERSKLDVKVLRDRIARAQKQLDLAEQRLKTRQQGSSDQVEKMYANLIRKAGLQNDRESDQATEQTPDRNPAKNSGQNTEKNKRPERGREAKKPLNRS